LELGVSVSIWGAGAVGLGLASALARPEKKLQLLVRNERLATTLREQGIRRTGLFGEIRVPASQLEVITHVEALLDQPPDWLLVCTKAFATPDLARELRPIAAELTRTTRLLLCQNGWGNEIAFQDFWPQARLFHARIITGFHRRAETHVEITAHAASIALGSLFGEREAELTDLANQLSAGGLPTETTGELRRVLWAKMLYNCALNPLGALVGRRYGELTADPRTRALLEEVVHEIFRVLAAANFELPRPDAEAYLEVFYSELIPPTAEHESSMLQDLRAGNRTEIEALCGAVERLAETHRIATPVVSALAALIRVAEARGRKRD
jgi:2-dehydropantoate 2-reductase